MPPQTDAQSQQNDAGSHSTRCRAATQSCLTRRSWEYGFRGSYWQGTGIWPDSLLLLVVPEQRLFPWLAVILVSVVRLSPLTFADSFRFLHGTCVSVQA